MTHFAEIDKNGFVLRVIVADQDFINSGKVGNPKDWVQTSYNTRAGKHPQGKPFRKNYAEIGYTYDETRDAFIPPKPHDSWILDEETCVWKAPHEKPDDGKEYEWNEDIIDWEEVTR